MQKEAQICVVGKVFRPNRSKILALNKTLSEYFKIVKWYLSCNSKSKKFLHEKCYEDAKRLFNLNTALIQTARDKAVEILKSFEENRKESSILKLRRISIRFDNRCYSFSKTNNALTPYWLTLSLNRKERINLEHLNRSYQASWKLSKSLTVEPKIMLSVKLTIFSSKLSER
ncbi:MAG: hypothetical protein LM574_03420 [Archaeoglobus sp.]|nr:hypothetical protein [Archaeoglobus sp.]